MVVDNEEMLGESTDSALLEDKLKSLHPIGVELKDFDLESKMETESGNLESLKNWRKKLQQRRSMKVRKQEFRSMKMARDANNFNVENKFNNVGSKFYPLVKGNNRVARKQNFVFIKTMKCATETIGAILRRKSLKKNLNIMLPRDSKIYFSWPYLMDDSDYRLSNRPFQGLIDHAVYNKTIMNKQFPPETTHYITIIREPLKQFLSAFNYFAVAKIAGINSSKPISEYLQNVKHYEKEYKRPNAIGRACIPNGFSITKNLIAHCLGMPLGFPKNRTDISQGLSEINKYIEKIDREFSLVMIADYFPESLILLKRMMGWTLQDMIFLHLNGGSYKYFLSDHDKMLHKQWSHIDYMIYDHFNQTFWKKIAAEGSDFFDEVQHFNFVLSEVDWFCRGPGTVEGNKFPIQTSPFNSMFFVFRKDCKQMEAHLREELKQHFDKNNKDAVDIRSPNNKTTC